jgi:hypothetical protein
VLKKQKIDEGSRGVLDVMESAKEQVKSMSKKEFEAFLRNKAEEIKLMAIDTVLDEIADKVMAEGEEGNMGQVVGEQDLVDREEEQEILLEAVGVQEASK